MNSSFLLILNKRIKLGKRYNVKLRNNGKIPAVVYDSKLSVPVYFDKKNLHALSKIMLSGFKLIECSLDGENFFVFIKDIYKHPSKLIVLHLDFQKINKTDIVTSNISFNFIEEKESPGIKKGGFLIKQMSQINIRANASNIPSYINVNLSKLDFNKPLFLSDIIMPNDIKLSTAYKKPSELLVASVIGSKTSAVKEETVD